MKVYTLDAFTSAAGGGNPAGVVLQADHLTVPEMMSIAKKMAYSETAFVMRSQFADFKIRFFSPTDEVALCGHATIATFKLLHHLGLIDKKEIAQETLAGILKIRISDEGIIWMEQALPSFKGVLPKEEIADSLGLKVSDLVMDLPVEMVSTGLTDIFVPVKNLEILKNMVPDMKKVSDISKKYYATGYHVFTMESLYHNTANCRNLAPLYGIDEEAATGTSNGALSSYLYKHMMVDELQAKYLCFEQGHFMNRPSYILACLETNEDKINQIFVGGDAILIDETEIDLVNL